MKRLLECEVTLDDFQVVNYVFDISIGAEFCYFMNLINDSIQGGCISDLKINLIYDE